MLDHNSEVVHENTINSCISIRRSDITGITAHRIMTIFCIISRVAISRLRSQKLEVNALRRQLSRLGGSTVNCLMSSRNRQLGAVSRSHD